MKYQIYCLSLLFVLSLSSVYCQSNQKLSETGLVKDWFLSTGDWQTDPQIYVREIGSGLDTIIMLHGGWGGEHGGLLQSVGSLKDKYTFIFYDQRGSLRSPFPDSLITFQNHIRDLELLRKELNLSKVTLVAHSMGAVLASAYAQAFPERIEKLILLAPAYLVNPLSETDQFLQQQATKNHQEFMKRPEVQQEFAKYVSTQENAPISSRQNTANFRINFAKRMLFDIGNWNKLSGGRAMYKGRVYNLTADSYPPEGWNYYKDFEVGNYDVTIIVGDHDFLDMGNQLIQRWTSENPDITLKIIKNAGHIIWLDQPEEFKTEIDYQLSAADKRK